MGLPPNRVQVAIVFGLGALLALLDWVEYRHFDFAIAVAVGAILGLAIRLVRWGVRRHGIRPLPLPDWVVELPVMWSLTDAELAGLLAGIAAVLLIAGSTAGWIGVLIALPCSLVGVAVVLWIKRYWR